MNIIPVTVLDNFLPEPDKIRDWALTLKYNTDPSGKWPGQRSEEVSQVNRPFYDFFCKKYFSLFWDIKHEPINWDANLGFQRITKDYGLGWSHSDTQQSLLTAIVYLNPKPAANSGTSILKLKDPTRLPDPAWQASKERFMLGDRTNETVLKHRELNNACYEETIRVNNVYNRLITFDAHCHHAAHDYLGGEDDERLTLVLFVDKLVTSRGPVHRANAVVL
jgi:hypothetical protein